MDDLQLEDCQHAQQARLSVSKPGLDAKADGGVSSYRSPAQR